jgi:hypothetical protein
MSYPSLKYPACLRLRRMIIKNPKDFIFCPMINDFTTVYPSYEWPRPIDGLNEYYERQELATAWAEVTLIAPSATP